MIFHMKIHMTILMAGAWLVDSLFVCELSGR